MHASEEQLVRACARMDPGVRNSVVDALELMRQKLLEDIIAADFNLVESGRGAVRMIAQIIHIMKNSPEIIRQFDARSRGT